jgi:hypothetical protein
MALAPAPRSLPALASSSLRRPKSVHRSSHPMTEPARTQASQSSSTIPALTAAAACRYRDLRARSSSSPSPLRAGGRHRYEYVMTPGAFAAITTSSLALASAGDHHPRPPRRSRTRSPTRSADHLLQISTSTTPRSARRPQPLALTPLSRTCADPSAPAKSP